MSKSTENDDVPNSQTKAGQKPCFRNTIEDARSNCKAMAALLERPELERLVRAKVCRFKGRGIDAEDLSQIALIALQDAIRKVPLTQLDSLKSYAAKAIEHAIVDELRKYSSSNRQQWDSIAEYSKIESAIFEATGNQPTALEVYEKLGWSELKISRHQSHCSLRDQSLESIMNPPNGSTTGFELEKSNLPESESFFSSEEHNRLLRLDDLIRSLPPDEEHLIRNRYLMKTSQKKYAKQHKMTEHKVKTTETRALARLKNAFEDDSPRDEGMKG